MCATLGLAGFRISEMLDLRFAHVDLARGRFKVIDAKTDAGIREVEMTLYLRDELLAYVMDRQRRELPYEAMLASGKTEWSAGDRVRVYRTTAGSGRVVSEPDDESGDADVDGQAVLVDRVAFQIEANRGRFHFAELRRLRVVAGQLG